MRDNCIKYFELTHSQKRIWYIDKINLNSSLHNIGGCLDIAGKVDVEKLKETIQLIIKGNDALNLKITEIQGQPFQYLDMDSDDEIDFVDFSNYEESKETFEKWSKKQFEKSFQIENGKLYYFAIYKLNNNKFGILLKIHHIISDGWSIGLIQRKICDIYQKLINNEKIEHNESFSYINYLVEENTYLNSSRFLKNKKYWNNKFQYFPHEFLYQSSDSLSGKRLSYTLDSKLSKEIKLMAHSTGGSINTLFLGILLIYINRLTLKKDIVLGTPVFNRTNKKQKNTLGMFTSTVPFRFQVNSDLNVLDFMNQVNREFRLCLLNQKYPYDLLIKDLELNKIGYDNLFKMSVNYYNSKFADFLNKAALEAKEYYSGSQSYSLQVIVKEWQDGLLTINYDYKISEYSDLIIKGMHSSIIHIIKELLTKQNLRINEIKLLSEEEINQKVFLMNKTAVQIPDKTIYQLFEEQAAKTPNNIALESGKKFLTYQQLNEKANQIAHYLKSNEIGRESIIAIMMDHSFELVSCIIGIQKAGGAYLPIDPEYPPERINYMLKDSKSNLLLINTTLHKEIEKSIYTVNIKSVNLESFSSKNPENSNTLDDLAYIIYTSGSTGQPKGVMIEHRGLTNYICWANKMYLQEKNESMALYSSIAFDLTITTIFTPLISGNKIIIYDSDEREFVLYKILRENKTTVLKLTPSHLSLMKEMDNRSSCIKRLIVGGEDLKTALAKEIYISFGKKVEIYNEYGPTESTVGCMIHRYNEKRDIGLSVPIGIPANNVQIYLLNSNLDIVPNGLDGEIYVSGDGIARGYLNRKDLTAEKFIDNPFIKGKKMYTTGDSARYLDDGTIEYQRRNDTQVKIRGHRIEPGEIERCLKKNEFITDAVVVCKEDLIGNKSLNAYIVGTGKLKTLTLKHWLMEFLPGYMIPNQFILIDKIPLTFNGKIDFAKLPEPELHDKEFIKSETAIEQTFVSVMEQVLGIEKISLNDNYFQLGGDSIKAIQISSKLKDAGLQLKVKDILSFDRIKEIAATIKRDSNNNVAVQELRTGYIEKTPIIEYFLQQKFANPNHYYQYVLLDYNKSLKLSDIEYCTLKLIEHHDELRINYDKEYKKLFYNEKYIQQNNAFQYLDLSENIYDSSDIDVQSLIENMNSKIDDTILFHIYVIKLGNKKQSLLCIAHHLIIDGISWRIILEDFCSILAQKERMKTVSLPLKTHSFKEWASELKEYSRNDFKNEINYWQAILSKKMIYPVDFNGIDIVKTSALLTCELKEDFIAQLIEKGKEVFNITFNEILMIGLALAINKITNNDEVIIEVESHGREEISKFIDVSRTIGWFTSIYPVYIKIEHDSNTSIIKSMKEQIRNIPNKGFHYGIMKFENQKFLQDENKYIRFNYMGDIDNIIDKRVFDYTKIEFGLSSAQENHLTALMDINAMIINKILRIDILYSKAIFLEESIQSFMKYYKETLQLILKECESKGAKEFTPSDFENAAISQEDLDALLG